MTLSTVRSALAMETTGSSASAGNVMIRSTSFFTSCRTRPRSEPVTSSRVTVPTPSRAWLETFLTSRIPAVRSSIARRMPCSTSSGLAPG